MKKRNLVLFGTVATLSLALAGTIGAVTASAAELSSSGSSQGTLELSFSQEDSWSVTLPASITIGTAAEVKAHDVDIAEGSTLKVTLKGTGTDKWELTEDQGSKKIEYSVKKGSSQDTQDDAVSVGGSILEVSGGTSEGTVYIKADIDNKKSTGGKEYKDTLTFEAAVE